MKVKIAETQQSLFPPESEVASALLPATSISDEFCCELLAWFHVCGGSTEAVVLDDALSADLRRAARRLNIEGGESPDAALLQTLQSKMREAKKSLEKDIPPVWILNVTNRYHLPRPRRGIDY